MFTEELELPARLSTQIYHPLDSILQFDIQNSIIREPDDQANNDVVDEKASTRKTFRDKRDPSVWNHPNIGCKCLWTSITVLEASGLWHTVVKFNLKFNLNSLGN